MMHVTDATFPLYVVMSMSQPLHNLITLVKARIFNIAEPAKYNSLVSTCVVWPMAENPLGRPV